MENKEWIWVGIIFIVFFVMGFGSIWTHNISNGTFTVEIKMDEDTRNYLVEHDYCVFTISEGYSSTKPSYSFLGDCEYLDSSLIKIKELEAQKEEKEVMVIK